LEKLPTNEGKHEIKLHLPKQLCHFCFFLQVFRLFYHYSCFTGLECFKCAWITEQDQKSHTHVAGYVLQMSKCISLQIMHFAKNGLR